MNEHIGGTVYTILILTKYGQFVRHAGVQTDKALAQKLKDEYEALDPSIRVKIITNGLNWVDDIFVHIHNKELPWLVWFMNERHDVLRITPDWNGDHEVALIAYRGWSQLRVRCWATSRDQACVIGRHFKDIVSRCNDSHVTRPGEYLLINGALVRNPQPRTLGIQ